MFRNLEMIEFQSKNVEGIRSYSKKFTCGAVCIILVVYHVFIHKKEYSWHNLLCIILVVAFFHVCGVACIILFCIILVLE